MTVSERPVNQLIRVEVKDSNPVTRRNLIKSVSAYSTWAHTGPATVGGVSMSRIPSWYNGGQQITATAAGAFVFETGGLATIPERAPMTFSVTAVKHNNKPAVTVTPRIRWSTGAVTTGAAVPLTQTVVDQPDLIRLSVSATPPVGATTGELELFGTFSGATVGFSAFGPMAEYGTLREFFNGSTPDTDKIERRWAGAEYASESIETIDWIDLNCKVTGFNATRGGKADGAANSIQVGTSTLNLVGDIDLGVTTYLRPNCGIRLRGPAGIFYTATMIDAAQKVDYDKARNRQTVHTTITAADAAQAAGNTIRHGAVSPGGRETWAERITRLNTSATTFATSPPLGNQRLFYTIPPQFEGTPALEGWEKSSAVAYQFDRPGYNSVLRAVVPYAATARNFSVGQLGAKKTFTNLVPGKSYGITAVVNDTMLSDAPEHFWYRASIAGSTFGAEIQATELGWTYLPMAVFTATSTTHTLQLSNSRAISIGANRAYQLKFYDAAVYEVAIPDEYLLQDVAYESSLSNHYDVACDSVGARWWVDRNNVVQFRRYAEETAVVAIFTDDRNPGHLEFTDVDTSFDTRNVVNTLTLNQHGRALNDQGEPVANDYAELIMEPFSANAWGAREASLDTCLWLGFEHELDLETRAAEIFADRGNPSYRVRHVRWNAQENPELASALDVYDRVRVNYRGEVHTGRVIGLKHAVSQTRWMIDIYLTDVVTGPTFAELSTHYAGKTWAQMSALTAGETFASFSKRPLREV